MKNHSITQFLSKTSYGSEKTHHKTTTNAETLPELIKAFENHLKGAGFVFDGFLDFVDEDGKKIEKHLDGEENLY